MTFGSAASPLKVALYSILTSDSTLTGLVTGIVDLIAPQNQGFPYIVLDTFTETSDNTLGKGGRDVTVTYSVFTNTAMGTGSKTGLGVTERMIELLDHKETNITATLAPGYTCSYAELDNQMDGQKDDIIYQAIVRFRFYVQEV